MVTRSELSRRARMITLVITDSDGVMTDTGVYYAETGEVFKRFSIRDGMGVERLRDAGVETAFMTGETSGSVRARAAKLKISGVYLGVKNKKEQLAAILRESGVLPEQIAYIGDDVNDLGIIEEVSKKGITAAPADAMPEVLKAVHYRTRARAGHGAFRDFAEWLLALRRVRR